MKLFIDSNIFLRYLVIENQTSFNECKQLLTLIKSGEITPYISNVVIQEVIYVLLKIYKQDKKQILSWVNDLLSLRNITIVEFTNTHQAISLYHQLNIKFGDCLIATQIPPKNTLCTYDTDFAFIPHLQIATPEKILKNIKPRKY